MKKTSDKLDDKKATGIVSFRLKALASSMFAVVTLFLPDFIRSAVARPPKFEYFSRLPDDIVRHVIAGFLNPVDKQNFGLSYKNNLRLLKPILDITHFQTCVARGEQAEAQRLLLASKSKDKINESYSLFVVETFTDYSGRTFTCSAYEYAYWAKDRHMLRMLEAQMNELNKAALSARINKLEQQGLTYMQHGKTITGSKHFDITPLKKAYEDYIRIYTEWEQADYPGAGIAAIVTAWMNVGKAQRDLPVHYVNEFFRRDRFFYPTPEFNETNLPRELTFKNSITDKFERLFPGLPTASSGLSVDFAIIRGARRDPWQLGRLIVASSPCVIDLAAFTRLDEVRTNDLIQSRKNLEPSAASPGMSF